MRKIAGVIVATLSLIIRDRTILTIKQREIASAAVVIDRAWNAALTAANICRSFNAGQQETLGSLERGLSDVSDNRVNSERRLAGPYEARAPMDFPAIWNPIREIIIDLVFG